MNEIWKDVKDYEGLYQVSNLGNVKRILFRNRTTTKQQEHILAQVKNKDNRKYVSLYKNDMRKNCIVHRLVAKAFIPNLLNKPEINHIDGNPTNNNVNNLEWCTASENMTHAYINNLSSLKERNEICKKPIIRCDNKKYDCAYAAAKDINVSVYSIRDCLKKRIKTCKGYSFDYINIEWSVKND